MIIKEFFLYFNISFTFSKKGTSLFLIYMINIAI